jgi:hypothetical protein
MVQEWIAWLVRSRVLQHVSHGGRQWNLGISRPSTRLKEHTRHNCSVLGSTVLKTSSKGSNVGAMVTSTGLAFILLCRRRVVAVF